MPDLVIELASPADVPEIERLIDRSVRELQRDDYRPAQLAAALAGGAYGVDTALIADQTYYVVRNRTDIIASGGWGKRRTPYGGAGHAPSRDDSPLDPRVDAARIRAFYVRPDYARRGIGSRLLDVCEAAARAAEFRRTEMGATITGARLYEKRGYVAIKTIELALPDGEVLPIVHMQKLLIT